HLREHLCVFLANEVAVRRRQPELDAQPAQELGRAVESQCELFEGLGELLRLGHEVSERKDELTSGDSPCNIVESDAGILERAHQANEVDIRGVECALALARFEKTESAQPVHVLDRARDQCSELLRRQGGHQADPIRNGPEDEADPANRGPRMMRLSARSKSELRRVRDDVPRDGLWCNAKTSRREAAALLTCIAIARGNYESTPPQPLARPSMSSGAAPGTWLSTNRPKLTPRPT